LPETAADGAVAEAVAEHLEFIAGETLAVEVPVVLAAALSTEITAAAEPRQWARAARSGSR
jgi:hypothetical protein